MKYIAQRKIVKATKELMSTTDFNSISVTQIMRQAKLRRQTFYDYFKDKYEVLAWIYNDDMTEIIRDNLTYEHWTKVLKHTLEYFNENRQFYQQVFQIQDQNAPEEVIFGHVKSLVHTVFEDLINRQNMPLNNSYGLFLETLITETLVNEVKRWILDDHPQSIELEFSFLKLFIDDNRQGLITRLG